MLYNGEQIGDGSPPRGRHRGRPARGHDARRARDAERAGGDRAVGARHDVRPRARASTWRRWPARRRSPTCSTSTARSARRSSWSPSARAPPVGDVMVVVLDRPRHEEGIAAIREAGARVRLIAHGDVSAALLAVTERSPRRPAVGHRRHARGRDLGRRGQVPRRPAARAAVAARRRRAPGRARRRLRPRPRARRATTSSPARTCSSRPPASPTATCCRACATRAPAARRPSRSSCARARARSGASRATHDRAKLRAVGGERFAQAAGRAEPGTAVAAVDRAAPARLTAGWRCSSRKSTR